MKKWIAALLIGGFILLMGYRQPIREFAGSHLLQWYCAHMLGVKVKTKTFEWGERKFVLQGVTASAEGLGSLEVETVTVRYEPHWLLRQIHIDAKVEQPKIAGKLGSSAEEPFFAIFPFRKLTGTIHFKQGECTLAEGQPPLEFNGFCRFDKRIHSYLTINEKEKLPQATFNLKQGKHQRYHVQLSLDQFPARVLSPYLEKGFVEEGILSGNLDIDYSPNSTPYALGDVICDGLKVRKDHLTAQFGKIHLNLNEEESKISVAKHAKISFKDLQGHSHEINQVGGHFEVQEDGDFTFNLSGFCRHDEEKKTLVVTGGQKDQLFQLDLHFVTRQQEDSQLSLSIKKGEREDLLEMAFNHFDRQSFQTTQHLLMPLFPSLDHVIFHNGHLTANLKGILRNGVIDELSFNHFSFQNGKIHFPYWQFSCGADSLIGKGSIQFSHPHPIETLFSEADVKNGYLHFDSISNLGTLKQIQSQIRVEKGVIQNSKASVSWAGLKGEMELKGLSPQEIVKVSLKGNSSDLVPFLPEKWGKKIEGEELSVVAKFGRANRGFVTKGEISLDSPLTHDKETLLFALEFEKNKQHPFTQSPELGASWDSMIPHFLHMVAPHFTYPQGHLHSPSQTEYLSFGQFQFKQGWIKSDEIAFEKYFGVFLPSSLQLTGTGPIHAIFDANEFFLRYHSDNLRFENDHFLLNIEQMQTQTTLPAFHYINFNSTSSFSFIPVKQALFLDKGTQLSFEDLRGDIIYDGDQLHVPKCTGYCKGMEFSSQIAIEHKEDIDVNFKFHTLDGSFTELRQILEHLAIPDFLSQIPLEGKFALRDPGLLFQINQQGTNITGSALIENGEIAIEPNTLNIKDLSLNIEYDQERSSLVFDEINGSVLLGSGDKVEEYQLGGLGISFDHIIEKRATFDLVVKDHNAEVIRISGAAFPGDAEGGIEICLNPSQSHFGLIYPEEINFLLKDWHTIEAFDAKFSFHLNDVLQTFQRFQQADISLSHVLDKCENMGGECSLETHYDWDKGRIDFAVTGEDILINQRHFNTFQAHGYYKNQTYFLEQFQLDPLHLSAEFCKQHDHLIANFIGLRYGDSLLMGLEGELDLNTYATTANIKMLEMNLSRSAELLSLPKNLSGFLSGQGEYCDDVLQLNLSHRDIKWGKIGVQDHEDVTVIIDPEVTLKNFSGTFFNLENPSQTITIHSESLALPSSKQPLAVDQLNFSVSPENIPWLLTTFSIPSTTQLPKLKQSGNITGSISHHHEKSLISLDDGPYTMGDTTYPLKNTLITIDPQMILFQTDTQLNHLPFQFTCQTSSSTFNQGTFQFNDLKSPHQQPLTITWSHTPNEGFSYQSAEGSFSGLLVNLNAKTADEMIGSVQINGKLLEPLLNPHFLEPIQQWKIGKGYTLEGTWTFPRDFFTLPKGFSGTLEGNLLALKGYIFHRLSGELNWNDESLSCKNLTLDDASGFLSIKEVDVKKNHLDQWHLTIPEIEVRNFRPSLLQEIGAPPPEFYSPLMVREISLYNLKGNLSKNQSLTGAGIANFVNPIRKNSNNLLFAIPTEIINRIGLNTGILTPVKGEIYFHLQEGKIYLDKFKDMYSDRKLSKFYLSPSSPSYIDNAGNLFVQIGMKQYNLLFKIAELFTVTVQGTLLNPTYTLQKQREGAIAQTHPHYQERD